MDVFDNKPSIKFLDFWIFNSKEETNIPVPINELKKINK